MMDLNFNKMDGLVPVVVQDFRTGAVLMLAFMNKEALEHTKKTGRVTFYSRTRGKLWTKGETSGNYLIVKEILVDCDNDSILIKADPIGVVCHTGRSTCFEDQRKLGFLGELEDVIRSRQDESVDSKSYTATLFHEGINRIAQKVGEEAVETVIASKDDDTDRIIEESADLIFHLLVLLRSKGIDLNQVINELVDRIK